MKFGERRQFGEARFAGGWLAALVVLLVTLTTGGAAIAANPGPSFDCAAAATSTEVAICSSRTLVDLDRQVAAAYSAALHGATSPATRDSLRQRQAAWRQDRDTTCADDESCLEQSYQQRLAQLGSLAASPAVPAAGEETAFDLLANADLPGGDFRSGVKEPGLRRIALSQCQNQCAADQQCAAFTYNRSQKVCFLKQVVPSSQPYAGATSGIKRTAATLAMSPQAANATPATVAGTASEAASQDIVARLASPLPSLEPWKFRMFNGRPVVDFDQLRKLIRLTQLAKTPGLLDSNDDAIAAAKMFLEPEVQEELIDSNSSNWVGADEFARAETSQLFKSRYAPLIIAAAPRLPFDMLIVGRGRLASYQAARGGFPISGDNPTDLTGHGLGVDAQSRSAKPVLLWRISIAKAPAKLRSLPDRNVVLVADLHIDSIDAQTLHYAINSLSIYTTDLSRKLADIPVENDPPSLAAGVSAALAFDGPAPLDETTLCAEVLANYGAQTPERVMDRCWSSIADRDAKFYAGGTSLHSLAPADSNRPFFPRGGMAISPEGRIDLVKWAGAYAAGIAKVGVTVPASLGSSDANGARYQAITGSAPTGLIKTLLNSQQFQEDQLLGDAVDEMSVIVALPNSAALYAGTLKRDDNPLPLGTTRLGIRFARQASLDDGRPALLLGLDPQATDFVLRGQLVATRTYEDIPRLDGGTFEAQQARAGSPHQGPLDLNATTIDLLAAANVGDHLSPETLAFMVTRRWVFESRSAQPDTDRFFERGKRQPTPQEAATLGAAFVSWAKSFAPVLPARVVVREATDLQHIETSGWFLFGCLEGASQEFASIPAFIQENQCRPDKPDALQGAPRCLAAKISEAAVASVRNTLGECVGDGYLSLGFSDPLISGFRFLQPFPKPEIKALGGEAKINAAVAFEITAITLARHQPSVLDVVPARLRQALVPNPEAESSAPAGDFVTMDASVVDAQYTDPDGHALADLGAPPATDFSKLQALFDQQLAAAQPGQTAPMGPYGPDLVGVQLGMSFADAEAVIRKHMTVGDVLDGNRGVAATAGAAFDQPLTSGKLFVSTDGHEYVAVFDEPPTAAGQVVAAWRRLYLPADSYTPEEVFAGIEGKYGKPNDGHTGSMEYDSVSGWFKSPNRNCGALYGAIHSRFVMEVWTKDGRPVQFASPNTMAVKEPALSAALLDPLSPNNLTWKGCGPVITAQFLPSRMTGAPMGQLDMALFDAEAYGTVYAQSRSALRAQATGTAGGQPALPTLKF